MSKFDTSQSLTFLKSKCQLIFKLTPKNLAWGLAVNILIYSQRFVFLASVETGLRTCLKPTGQLDRKIAPTCRVCLKNSQKNFTCNSSGALEGMEFKTKETEDMSVFLSRFKTAGKIHIVTSISVKHRLKTVIYHLSIVDIFSDLQVFSSLKIGKR